METSTKQLEAWSDINRDIPTNIEYQYLLESLKINQKNKEPSKVCWYARCEII